LTAFFVYPNTKGDKEMSNVTVSKESITMLNEIIDYEIKINDKYFTSQQLVEKMIRDCHSEIDYLKRTEPEESQG
jgi:hypothetical protein